MGHYDVCVCFFLNQRSHEVYGLQDMSALRINSPIVYTCLCIVLFTAIHVHSLQFDGANYRKWKLQHVWKSSTWMILFICSLPSDTLSATELSIPSPYEHYSTANPDRIWNLSNG